MTTANELASKCELLRTLHRPGDPLVLPNAWDAATAKAVAAAGFPAVELVAELKGMGAAGCNLKDYPGAPHGLTATHQDEVNRELLAFIKGQR